MSRNIIRKIFIAPITFYQKCISPLLGGNCIYTPSCSTYAKEAIMKHGVIKGLILGIARILRCNRLFLGGNDPVPETFSFKHLKNQYIIFRR